MLIKKQTALGKDALINPRKYNGFMGISILHKYFAPKRMKYFIEWGSEQFQEFIIILMDDPDQYNFQVFRSLSPTEALEKARGIGKEIKASYIKILNKKNINNVKVKQFKDFKNRKDFQDLLSTLYEYSADRDSELHKSLETLVDSAVGKKFKTHCKIHQLSTKETNKQKNVLLNHTIEELASLIYFTEIGYPIELDPTIEFPTKKLLYEGHYPKVNDNLNLGQRGHIYLHPEGITKN
jgi:tRNA-dependent cyclodipeptide synthase